MLAYFAGIFPSRVTSNTLTVLVCIPALAVRNAHSYQTML